MHIITQTCGNSWGNTVHTFVFYIHCRCFCSEKSFSTAISDALARLLSKSFLSTDQAKSAKDQRFLRRRLYMYFCTGILGIKKNHQLQEPQWRLAPPPRCDKKCSKCPCLGQESWSVKTSNFLKKNSEITPWLDFPFHSMHTWWQGGTGHSSAQKRGRIWYAV